MTGALSTFQDLIVWQRGIDLVEAIYVSTARWPDTEKYGLTNQLRRAAVSIPANIAEGHGRGGANEFARYLSIARGSLREVMTYLIIAQRLRFVDQLEFDRIRLQADEVGRLLQGLARSLERK